MDRKTMTWVLGFLIIAAALLGYTYMVVSHGTGGPEIRIGSCTHEKDDEITCENGKIAAYVALPEPVREEINTESGETVVRIEVKNTPACLRKIVLRGIRDERIVLRVVEQNVPFTIGIIDTNSCSWVLR